MNKLMLARLLNGTFLWSRICYYIAYSILFLTFKECVMCTVTVSKGKTINISHPFFPTSQSHAAFAQLKKQLKHRPLKTQWCWRRVWVWNFIHQLISFSIIRQGDTYFLILLQVWEKKRENYYQYCIIWLLIIS